jgi:hypothetical protein
MYVVSSLLYILEFYYLNALYLAVFEYLCYADGILVCIQLLL